MKYKYTNQTKQTIKKTNRQLLRKRLKADQGKLYILILGKGFSQEECKSLKLLSEM